jgi:glycosyltransferase involved in cell wall biosynthesis
VAVEVAAELNAMGLRAELHTVGCQPTHPPPPFVVSHGFLSKSRAQERERLDRLFREACFLILPSRAECVAVAFAEAACYALPVVATNVGGNATAVGPENGRLFDLDAPPAEYVRFIASSLRGEQYARLCRGSVNAYRTRLNWRTAGTTVVRLLEDTLRDHARRKLGPARFPTAAPLLTSR